MEQWPTQDTCFIQQGIGDGFAKLAIIEYDTASDQLQTQTVITITSLADPASKLVHGTMLACTFSRTTEYPKGCGGGPGAKFVHFGTTFVNMERLELETLNLVHGYILP